MKRVLLLILALIVAIIPCGAIDHSNELLTLVSLTPETATQSKITAMLGKPSRIEENKKRTWWYYSRGTTNVVVCWNKKSELMERVSFKSDPLSKQVFDTQLSHKLKSGSTDISTALKLLGPPKDMTLKVATQEMHYAYQNNVLRLFFRNKTLVDFCLY